MRLFIDYRNMASDSVQNKTCELQGNCIQEGLERSFERFGLIIARHPWVFILPPIVVSLGLLGGLANFNHIIDVEYLYTPTNGQAKEERRIIRKHFPENDTHNFVPSRKIFRNGFFQVIITSADSNGNIFTVDLMERILEFNTAFTQLSTQLATSNETTYPMICAKVSGSCYESNFLRILNGSGSIIEDIGIGYPLHLNRYYIADDFGDVEVNAGGFIESAEAFRLTYYFQYQSESEIESADLWMKEALDFMSTYSASGLSFHYQGSISIDEELAKTIDSIILTFSITYTIIINFCVFSSIIIDPVRNQPWFALAGAATSGLAIISSLGFLPAVGVPFTITVGCMPLLLVGIGIDDMFVLLSCWRHTDFTKSVEDRMSLTLKSAAVSITLTSVTNALAFGIGAITTFRSITLFCAYTGIAVIFCYIYSVTFLAGILVLCGRREAANRHSMTCMKVLPRDKVQDRSKCYMECCTGGYEIESVEESTATLRTVDSQKSANKQIDSQKSTNKQIDSQISTNKQIESQKSTNEHIDSQKTTNKHITLPWLTIFIRDKFALFITLAPCKLAVVIIYLMYLSVSIYGFTTLEQGLQLRNLAPDDSYVASFYEQEEKYFTSRDGLLVMFAFTESLDYSDAQVRAAVDEELSKFRESSLYKDDDLALISWLDSVANYLAISGRSIPNDMTQFIALLRNEFFMIPEFKDFQRDVDFNSDFTEITASRFLIQSSPVLTTPEQTDLMTESRALAERSELKLTVYNFGFIYFDTYTLIVRNTVQNLLIAVASMAFVSFLLLPSIISVLWVALSIISICTGVIGFMSLWNVPLDSVAMVNLIMCIGFSVDFSAHISYHFATSKGRSGNARVKEALGVLGQPVLQGALSTILGISLFSTSNNYIFRTFFKILSLVMVFGFMHAMFFLPVILSLTSLNKRRNSTSSMSNR